MITSLMSSLILELNKIVDTYSQLPLNDVNYPFCVVEEVIDLEAKPKIRADIVLDLWNNSLSGDTAIFEALASKLYDFTKIRSDVYYFGKMYRYTNIPTGEEGLTRRQLKLVMKGFLRNGI